MTLARKVALGVVIVLVILLGGTCAARSMLSATAPRGPSGPEADALARTIAAAVRVDAWERTGAVTWNFFDRNQHLWDRQRSLVRVTHGDAVVLLDLTTRNGKAWKAGQPVSGAELRSALDYAWAAWANDSFWLNPLAKLFDEGVTREKVSLPDDPDGAQGLLVRYSSGGVTPGDQYLWITDAQGTPIAWRMWTAVFPVPGVRVSWDDWITLDTGARVATKRRLPGIELELTDVRGAETLRALVGEQDPFAPLYE